MDDAEGGLNFDFEGGLDSGPTHPTASVPVIQPSAGAGTNQPFASGANANNSSATPALAGDGMTGAGAARRSFRQTVCRHWLRSLCMKGDACGFLHQYDKTRMPVCRFFRIYGECREPDCVYKHTNEDIKECNMFKMGFCPNGQDCRYRHAKLPGPPPPVEEVLQKIQQLTSFNYSNSNRFFQNRNTNYTPQTDKSQLSQGANGVITVKTSDVVSGNGPQPQQVEQSPQGQNLLNGEQNQASRSATPLPQGTSRYFVVKSCNRENLELSVQQGVWATQRSNEAKLNEAFESTDNVILIFSVNKTRNFQGCAKMTTKIGGSVSGGNWKHAHGTAHYGRNFDLKWLKLCELSFQKTRHLRNPYNENLPVKISRDCQELEPSIGEQLASLLYLEPDSELMAISVEAETKREEEKDKGIQHVNNGKENPDIVPFEDNEEEEEEEEEESEEEDENQAFGAQGRGRGGRGNNMMWPPHMIPSFPRGLPRPFHGMHGFPPNMMDGFPMQPDMFVMPPRGFGPYGPRFPGPMFRPGGFGVMMGPGRPPFMGRGGPRPHPFYPPQRPGRDQNEGKSSQQQGGDEGRYRKAAQREDHYSRNNNESEESEDEAPRRSRHGEGKKKRRGSDVDSATLSDGN